MNSKKVKAKNGRLMEKSNCYICGKKKSKFIKGHSGGALTRRKGPSTVDKIAYVASNFVTPSPSFASMARLLAGQALKGVKDNVDYYKKGKGLDIQKHLSKLGELHMRTPTGKKYNYCGPGTKLEKRLASNDPKYRDPINNLDSICQQHDIDYSNSKSLADKHKADDLMLKRISKIPFKDRPWGTTGVQALIASKRKIGLGKAVVIERFNRTLKNKMWKQFTVQGNTQYLDMLPKLVKEYNNTKHGSIKMTPTEASKKKNEGTVYFNLYGDMEPLSAKPKFKVGDKVRISKYKRIVFDKGYTPNWSEEMFVITKIQHTNPITYKIKDLNDEEIKGSFYEPELLKAKQDVFRIDKVIRRDYKKKQALVKWKGYSDDFNSWIPIKDLKDI
ncbi:hypothetical protein ACROYT_G038593 [Oculina patagonica]